MFITASACGPRCLSVAVINTMTKSSLGRKGFILQLPGPSQSEGSERAGWQGKGPRDCRGTVARQLAQPAFFCHPEPPAPCTGSHISHVSRKWPTGLLTGQSNGGVLKVVSSQMTMFVSSWQKLASRHVYQVSVCLSLSTAEDTSSPSDNFH